MPNIFFNIGHFFVFENKLNKKTIQKVKKDDEI